MDEFAIRKGHSYATGVLNADTGRVLAVTNGRTQEAIQQALKTVQGNVAYIVSDLAPAMKKAIEEVFPKAIHVLDRFHVIQLITDALMRRRYYLDKKGEHQTVRHMNRLLTSEPGLLSEEDRKQVREWCLQDDNLSQLYKGLQHIRYVLKSTSMTQAKRRWNDWVQRFVWNRCSVMRKIVKTLLTKEEAFLSCAFLSLSNGVMEGTNNKIKLLKRRAYGYRNDVTYPFRNGKHKIKNLSSTTYGDEPFF